MHLNHHWHVSVDHGPYVVLYAAATFESRGVKSTSEFSDMV